MCPCALFIQASVVAAEPGVSVTDPDSRPLDLLAGVFNSFGGRLFDQVQSARTCSGRF